MKRLRYVSCSSPQILAGCHADMIICDDVESTPSPSTDPKPDLDGLSPQAQEIIKKYTFHLDATSSYRKYVIPNSGYDVYSPTPAALGWDLPAIGMTNRKVAEEVYAWLEMHHAELQGKPQETPKPEPQPRFNKGDVVTHLADGIQYIVDGAIGEDDMRVMCPDGTIGRGKIQNFTLVTPSPKFKVGDVVRFTGRNSIYTGKNAVVTKFDRVEDIFILFEDGHECAVFSRDVELIQRPQVMPGGVLTVSPNGHKLPDGVTLVPVDMSEFDYQVYRNGEPFTSRGKKLYHRRDKEGHDGKDVAGLPSLPEKEYWFGE